MGLDLSNLNDIYHLAMIICGLWLVIFVTIIGYKLLKKRKRK